MGGGDVLERGQNGGQAAGSPADGDSSDVQTVTDTIEDVAFPISMRGYDRGAVDSYVSRVREVVARLEASRAPEAAVKEALEKVGEQTKSVLESAGQSAEQITAAARREAEESSARAKSDAEDMVAKAKAEAKETVAKARQEAAEHLQRSRDEVTALRNEAEARLRELHADTESVRQQRGELLDEIRAFAARVEEVARAADARFPHGETAGTADAGEDEPMATEEADAAATAADMPTQSGS